MASASPLNANVSSPCCAPAQPITPPSSRSARSSAATCRPSRCEPSTKCSTIWRTWSRSVCHAWVATRSGSRTPRVATPICTAGSVAASAPSTSTHRASRQHETNGFTVDVDGNRPPRTVLALRLDRHDPPARPASAQRWVSPPFGPATGTLRGGEGTSTPSRRRGAPHRTRDQARSKRSRFMTLSHAATKSRTNFSCASAQP
jgi:hypothetical protein